MNKNFVAMSAVSLMLSMPFADFARADELPTVAPAANTEAAAAVDAAVSTPAEPPKAETAKTDAHQILGDVVVSASKIEQSSIEAPANVMVFTSKTLEKTNNQRVGDALVATVPGAYLRGGAMGISKPGVTATLSMRGQSGKTAVLVDGMNMADAYSGAINWSMISMEDVDRIEVVPGAGSSLYGSGAIAGVITITTKAPTKKEISVKSGVGFNDASGMYMSALYRNKFESGLGVVFGASRNDRDGYISEYVTKSPSGTPAGGAVVVNGAIQTTTTKGATTYIVGDLGKNASIQKNIHARLHFDPSPTNKLNAGFAYSDNKNSYGPYHSYLTNASTGAYVPISTTTTYLNLNGLGTTINERNFYGTSPGSTALRLFAGYEGEVLGNSRLNLNAGTIDRGYWYSSAGATASMNSGAGTLQWTPNSTSNISAQLSQPIGGKQFLVVGVATEIGILHQKRYNLSNWADVDSKTSVIDQVDARSVNNSLFIQDQVELDEKLTVYLGGRYDTWKAGADAAVITPIAPNVASNTHFADRSASAFTPKLAAVYKLGEGVSLKTSVGTGFNAPKNIDLFANPSWNGGIDPAVSKLTTSNPNLKPEKSRSFDLGLEYNFVQGGNFKAAYYVTSTTDLIFSKDTTLADADKFVDPISNKVINTTSTKENAGSSLARGIELSGAYPVSGWLTVSGSYAYTDARMTSDLTNTGMQGKRLTSVPKDMASLALEARQGDWSGVFLARHVGEQFTSNDNSDVVKDVWTGYSKYTVANLKVGYRIDKSIKLNLMVDNLFDRKYFEYYEMPGRRSTLELAVDL